MGRFMSCPAQVVVQEWPFLNPSALGFPPPFATATMNRQGELRQRVSEGDVSLHPLPITLRW